MSGTAIQHRAFGGSGLTLTTFGVGAGTQSNVDGEAAFEAMLNEAWAHGIRYFDTAPLYLGGDSERRLGRFLRAVDRSDITVSSKVGRLPDDPKVPYESRRRFDYSATGVVRSVTESLERLDTDRLDLVVVHDVDRRMHGERFNDILQTVRNECLPALAELKSAGIVGSVGVSSRQSDVCLQLVDDPTVDGFMMAGSYTLLNHEPLDELFPECLRTGRSVIIASPFNTGVLATGRPDATYDYRPVDEVTLNRVQTIADTCAAHDVPLPAAALAFPLHHSAVSAVVVGNRSAEEVRQNIDCLETAVPEALWDDLIRQGLLPPEAAAHYAV